MGTGIKPSPLFLFTKMSDIKRGILQYIGYNNYVSDLTIQLYLYGIYGVKVDRIQVETAVNEMLMSGDLVGFVFEFEDGTRRRLLFSKGAKLMENSVASVAGTSNSDT